MKIGIGSFNRTKVHAVQMVFSGHDVLSKDVPSDVSDQPFGDVETRQGAINRALHVHQELKEGIAIGLEGGVMKLDGTLFLCNWGALVTPDEVVYTAAGARVELPASFQKPLASGKELSEVMDAYTKKSDIRSHEGAIGIFTNEHIKRAEMFIHVVMLLKGQMEYCEKDIRKS